MLKQFKANIEMKIAWLQFLCWKVLISTYRKGIMKQVSDIAINNERVFKIPDVVLILCRESALITVIMKVIRMEAQITVMNTLAIKYSVHLSVLCRKTSSAKSVSREGIFQLRSNSKGI